MSKRMLLATVVVPMLVVGGPWTARVAAHCDGLDGPVVKAAERALETNNVDLVLAWVTPKDEPDVRAAFSQAVRVRTLGDDARQLADRYFFETVVRLHRVGEGEPYTGLKPAGRDLGPAIPAADRAIATGDLRALDTLRSDSLHHGLGQRYARVMALRQHDPADLERGRAYVTAYVEFIHYVERIHLAATAEVHGHYPDAVHEAETPQPGR
jgi:hypothetical protein